MTHEDAIILQNILHRQDRGMKYGILYKRSFIKSITCQQNLTCYRYIQTYITIGGNKYILSYLL